MPRPALDATLCTSLRHSLCSAKQTEWSDPPVWCLRPYGSHWTFILLWAGKRIVLSTETALAQTLFTLPVGSIFTLLTICHQIVVSHGQYCLLLLADEDAPTLPQADFIGRAAQIFEPRVMALPGRKIIALLHGDRHQLAYFELTALVGEGEPR